MEKALGTDIPKNAKMIQEAFDAITGTEAELDEVRASVSNCVKIQDLEPTLLNVVDSKFPVIAEAVFREIEPRIQEAQSNLDNDVSNARTAHDREVAEMKREMVAMKATIETLSGHVQTLRDNPAPVAASTEGGSALSEEEVNKIRLNLHIEDDRYFLNTISVKNINPEITLRENESPRAFARRVMAVDSTEGVAVEAKNVSIQMSDQSRAIRITYTTPWQLRRALARIGGICNELKRQGSQASLTYSQLTPPRLGEARKKLNTKLMNMKRQREITSFSFLVLRGELACRTVAADGLMSIIKLEEEEEAAPASEDNNGNPDGENMDTGNGPDTVCSICLLSMFCEILPRQPPRSVHKQLRKLSIVQ